MNVSFTASKGTCRCGTERLLLYRTRPYKRLKVSRWSFRRGEGHVAHATRLLEDFEAPPQEIDLPFGSLLTAEEYEDARNDPVQCNLQLKAADAEEWELESFPAALPAADACRFSPVIRSRLRQYPATAGRIELELDIEVSQELLDAVIRAIYDRSLMIDPQLVESLLLLADHLQLDWLLSAVARYGKQNLVSVPSLGVCKLAAAFPSLGFFEDAVRQLMMRPPSAEDFIDLLELTDPEQRAVMLRETAEQTSVVQRTAYLESLPASRARLSRQQARLLVGADPELLGTPGILECQDEEEADSLERWAELYVSYKEALLAQRSVEATRDFVVWDIPLAAAKAGERLESPGTLRTPDGRKFKISISSASITGKVGLYVTCVGQPSWKTGDSFKFMCVKNIENAQWTIEIPPFHSGNTWGFPSMITDFESQGDTTISNGEYLPVAMEWIFRAPLPEEEDQQEGEFFDEGTGGQEGEEALAVENDVSDESDAEAS